MSSADAAGSTGPRSDASWLAGMRDGGPEGEATRGALRAMILRGLSRALARRGVGADACEDLAQQAMLRIGERLDTYRGDSRFTTWAFSIALRVAFDELRHKRWSDVSFEDASAAASLPLAFVSRSDLSPERAALRGRLLVLLREILEDLTDKQRAVLVAELEGMPHAEMAATFGMNKNALYKLGHDARKKVKARLEAAGISGRDVAWAFE